VVGLRRLGLAALVLALLLVPALIARAAAVHEITLVSVGDAGAAADGASGPGVAVSGDGRYVAFDSQADNLSTADDDSVTNVYVRDMETGETTLVSRNSAGAGANGDSGAPAISPAGVFVAFESQADNLSEADNDAVKNVYVHNMVSGETTLISRADDGSPADGDSGDPSISAAGKVIAYESLATNLSAEDDDTVMDVFTYNTETATTSLISRINGSGAGAHGDSFDPSISKNGLRIAFASNADDIFSDDRDLGTNIYVAEPRFRFFRHLNRTSTSGFVDEPANGSSTEPVISSDGGFVAFTSTATNLGAVGAPSNIFLRYISANNTTLISREQGAGAAFTESSFSPAISGDGLSVAFISGIGDQQRVYVRHAYYGTTSLVSRKTGSDSIPADAASFAPALSRGADYVVFASDADNLSDADNDGVTNVFERRLPFVPTPASIPPDLGSNDHSGPGHGGHTDGEHTAAGHDAAGHAGHTGANHFRLVLGSLRADKIFGTATHDKVCGEGGGDTIQLGAGSDVGYGGECGVVSPPEKDEPAWWRTAPALRHALNAPAATTAVDGNDEIVGGKGEDAIFGGAGNDRLVGGSGRDLLAGGAGRDRLVGGPGRNRYEGGLGADSINAANGVRELVDCGFGRDRATADPRDRLTGCEVVKRMRKRAKKDLPELLPECPGGGHECHQGGTVVLTKVSRP
jgi:Tol biopolymer transport system component